MFGPRLTRVQPDGTKETIAEIPGGPNGAAVGPGGLVYVCNNGGRFTETRHGRADVPRSVHQGPTTSAAASRPSTRRRGKVTDLYTECDGRPLWAPNDLVFDAHGGFYFTDHGLDRRRGAHRTTCPASTTPRPTARRSREVVFPVDDPNGIGLSPDGSKLYWAETWRGRIMQRDIVAPGELAEAGLVDTSQCLYGFPGFQLLDSLAVDGAGNVCVATLVNGGVSASSRPPASSSTSSPTGDILTTNICFGGDDLTTAYITISTTGKLVKTTWPRPGAKLHHLNT